MNKKIKFFLFLTIFINSFMLFSNRVYARTKWNCYYKNPTDEKLLSAKGWFTDYAVGFMGAEGYQGMELQAFDGGIIVSNTEDIRNYWDDKKVGNFLVNRYYDRYWTGVCNSSLIVPYHCPEAIVVTTDQHNFYAFKDADTAERFAEHINSNTKWKANYAVNVPENEYSQEVEQISEGNAGESQWECYYAYEGLNLKGTFSKNWGGIKGYHEMKIEKIDGTPISKTKNIGNYFNDYSIGGATAKQYYTDHTYIGIGECPNYVAVLDHNYDIVAFRTEEERDQFVSIVKQSYTTYEASSVTENQYYFGYNLVGDINADCSLFSEEFLALLNKYLGWIRTLVPIGIIAYGTYDLISALTSGKEDEMRKCWNRFTKRIIIGIIIFFVPFIVNFILNIVNDAWGTNYSSCGIK